MNKTAEVVVVGGGSAGICAAAAAARSGAKTILLERSQILGGMGTLAKVHTFCGLYHPDVSKPPIIANQGLPAEIERLMRERTGVGPVKMGKVYVLPQDPTAFAEIALGLTSAEKNLEVIFGSECNGISRENDGTFLLKTSGDCIRGRALVDTSANAVVADLLGGTRLTVPDENKQRSAFVFSLEGVAPGAITEEFRMRLALDLVRAVAAGDLPKIAMGTACRASTKSGEVFFTTDLDPAPAAQLMAVGREFSKVLTSFLRGKYVEYSRVGEPSLASIPGVRETYRWLGKYTLTAGDLINANPFPDTVAYATWPMELRETTKGPRMTYFANSVPANIPLRALCSAEFERVFFAGRCISATHEALASVRVMGTCFATGQAAGVAAAKEVS